MCLKPMGNENHHFTICINSLYRVSVSAISEPALGFNLGVKLERKQEKMSFFRNADLKYALKGDKKEI